MSYLFQKDFLVQLHPTTFEFFGTPYLELLMISITKNNCDNWKSSVPSSFHLFWLFELLIILTFTRFSVVTKCETSLTFAFEWTLCVDTNLTASSVVMITFVNVWGQKINKLNAYRKKDHLHRKKKKTIHQQSLLHYSLLSASFVIFVKFCQKFCRWVP